MKGISRDFFVADCSLVAVAIRAEVAASGVSASGGVLGVSFLDSLLHFSC